MPLLNVVDDVTCSCCILHVVLDTLEIHEGLFPLRISAVESVLIAEEFRELCSVFIGAHP